MPKRAKSEENVLEEGIEKSIQTKAEESGGEKRSNTTRGRGAFWVSSGSDLMDEVVGGGRGLGYETGMTILFEAHSSSGKSFLAHEVVAAAYHKYKDTCKWLYLDCESGCTFDSKALYGVEVMPQNVEERKRPKTIEDAFSEIMLFGEALTSKELGIVVIDSIDGLISEEMEARVNSRLELYAKGKGLDDGFRGQQKALFLSREFFPTINEMVERKNVLCIIISQYRQAQGQYGSRSTISNGDAIKFYCHARVKFIKKEEIEIKGRSIGAIIEASTVKMKGPWPYRSCYFTVHYTRGLDNTSTNIEYLYNMRTDKEAGLKKDYDKKLFTWDDKEMTRSALIRYIEENDLERELRKRVYTKWEDEEAEAAKQLEGRKNRYE